MLCSGVNGVAPLTATGKSGSLSWLAQQQIGTDIITIHIAAVSAG